jgi:acetyltransferase-like isoleucine patch superfamily enzyme
VHNPFDQGYFRSDELRAFGFARVGEGSAIARTCTIVGLENIVIGDFVRIDGFTTIIATQGSLRIGSHVHICSGCVLGARGGIELADFSSLSHGVRLLSAIDDFSGKRMTNSTVPAELLGVQAAPIRIGRYVPIGSGCTILPGATIGEGSAVAAMSVVNRPLAEWTLYGGNPAAELGRRSRDLLALAKEFEGEPGLGHG